MKTNRVGLMLAAGLIWLGLGTNSPAAEPLGDTAIPSIAVPSITAAASVPPVSGASADSVIAAKARTALRPLSASPQLGALTINVAGGVATVMSSQALSASNRRQISSALGKIPGVKRVAFKVRVFSRGGGDVQAP